MRFKNIVDNIRKFSLQNTFDEYQLYASHWGGNNKWEIVSTQKEMTLPEQAHSYRCFWT